LLGEIEEKKRLKQEEAARLKEEARARRQALTVEEDGDEEATEGLRAEEDGDPLHDEMEDDDIDEVCSM
jgi:nuclear GTP-binding protein